MTTLFTLTDKALLMRAAREFDARAQALYDSHVGLWNASQKKCAEDKREHDRLRRDAHDLRTLAKRLIVPAGATEPVPLPPQTKGKP